MYDLLLYDRHVDADASVEGAALAIVAAIDSSCIGRTALRVVDEGGIAAVVVDIGLIDIARKVSVGAVGASEDATHDNGGATGHIDH